MTRLTAWQRLSRALHWAAPRITRADLRLSSGLVLFTYVTAHLANHALGLVSVNSAEAALRVAVAVWHSRLGSVLLYGAATTHLTLALVSIYERRTLRMPALEAVRIALGFGIPLLLIGHLATTRFAFELYGLTPDYARIVWTLWTSDGEGKQLALLVPGWLHGCLGLKFAFERRPLFQRLRPWLYAGVVVLPILAALGFFSMGRQLVSLGANSAWLEAHVPLLTVHQKIRLEQLRHALLLMYLGAVGLTFAARELRALFERNGKTLVTISYPGRTVRVPRGWTVLEASRYFGIPHRAECGGRARCSTCRVRVTSAAGDCGSPNREEQATLDRIGAALGVRLACQLRPQTDITVVPLRVFSRGTRRRRIARPAAADATT